MNKKNLAIKILKKIKPNSFTDQEIKKIDFIKDKLLDSFDIMNFLVEVEKKTKKKIDLSKLTNKSFKNINTISKLL